MFQNQYPYSLVSVFLFLFFFLNPKTNASTLNVCSNCQVKELQFALDLAMKGDTILIGAGTYECVNTNITKSITILGNSETIINGKEEGYVFKILADSVEISGLTIINSGRSYTKDFAAIYIFRSHHFKISNNTIVNPFFGILIEKSKDGLISSNTITGEVEKEDDGGNGIHLWHCSNIRILNNEVAGMRDGIYLEFVDFSQIEKNLSRNNVRYGLHFMFSNNDDYLENTFRNNGAGVAVMFSKFIVMKRNLFTQNWGAASYGLLLKEIYDAEVVDNVFYENTIAIFIDGTTRINYSGNNFKQNGWAIKVSGGCYLNRVYENNFQGNTFDVSYNSKVNDNSFDGNYWGNYSGYDLDKDGTGDVPFRPVKLFSYIVSKCPESIILMRSMFVDMINFSEMVSPIFTPDNLLDNYPQMRPF